MPQKPKNIEHLVFKLNNGTINSEELTVLSDWYNSHNDKKVTIPVRTEVSSDEIRERILSGLMAKVAASTPIKRLPMIFKIGAAAAILFVAFATWIALERKLPNQTLKSVTNIEPGGNKATLTLANGKTITLSNHQAGIIAGDQTTYTNGVPVENVTAYEHNGIQELTLRTPRGGNYNIILPDGTQVWLNAASSIKYPSQFSAAGRVVELEGEAYFQVKSIYSANGEKIPFKVIHKEQEVEVLGTQFNINAYPEQMAIKTTLVEGKVAISNQQMHVTLKPNQQAITNAGKISVRQVDVTPYIAWREGKFSFDGKTFEETMSDIGRWYDLDIVYVNKIPEEELAGDAFRNQNIGFVLRLLDVAEIDYKLDATQRKLTIRGKKNKL
jgi:transmembrane sensor